MLNDEKGRILVYLQNKYLLKARTYLWDPSLYILLAVNGYMIWEYIKNPISIHTIMLLYWVQSVLIGIFNFFDILTVQRIKKGSINFNNKNTEKKGCAAFFFLGHYGFFHLGYLLFLGFFGINMKEVDWQMLKFASMVLLASQIITFIQHKIRFNRVEANLGQMMFLPYLRIIPMHLAILLPAFIPVSGYVIFLILKAIFDIVTYIVYYRLSYKTLDVAD